MPLVNSLINGVSSNCIDIEDRALHYADGLFETMLYREGKIALWPQHFKRLKSGCEVLGLALEDEAKLSSDIKKLTQKFNNDDLVIKLIISRGAAGRGLIVDKKAPSRCILLAYSFDVNALKPHQTKKLIICKTPLLMNQILGGIKHLNRLLYVLAANELTQAHAEGVMVNDKNEMIECITHNLFFVKDSILYTAPINDCGVAGIKRQQVINTAKKLGMKHQIKAILVAELKQMDECFITNAVVGLQSVKSIDNMMFTQNTIMLRLQNNLIN